MEKLSDEFQKILGGHVPYVVSPRDRNDAVRSLIEAVKAYTSYVIGESEFFLDISAGYEIVRSELQEEQAKRAEKML
jgi:hypothetical protein